LIGLSNNLSETRFTKPLFGWKIIPNTLRQVTYEVPRLTYRKALVRFLNDNYDDRQETIILAG